MSRPLESARPSITILAGILLLGAVLSLARAVLIPIALAILLAFTLSPAVLALQRRRFSRTLAVLLVSGLALACIVGAVLAITTQLHTLAVKLPEHKDNMLQKIDETFGQGPGALARLARMVEELNARFRADPPNAIPVTVHDQNVLRALREATSSFIGIIGSIGLVIALTIAMLFKREDLRNRLIRLAGQGELTSTTRAIDEATRRISRYLQIQLAINAGFGLVLGLVLAILGVPYPLLWGFLAFLVRFIPYIGTWLAAVPPLILSFATANTWFQPTAVIVVTILLGLFINNILEPMLISRTTGVSPVGLIVAAAFWTWLWGPIGLVLSTPMTVCLAVLGRFVPPLQFLDVLFGTDPALDPQAGYYQRLLARDEVEAGEIVEAYLEEHSKAELCDFVLVPALVRAKEDHNLGHVSDDDLRYIVGATTDLLQDMGYYAPEEVDVYREGPAVPVVGCPAKDQVDELALRLFQNLLAPVGRVELMSTSTVASEVIEAVGKEQAPAALISAVHPGGLAKIRYLIKRLRAAFPTLHIEVGYWGLPLTDTKLPQQLKTLGASQVSTSLSESCKQLESFLRMAQHLKPAEAAAAPAV